MWEANSKALATLAVPANFLKFINLISVYMLVFVFGTVKPLYVYANKI